MRSKTSHCFIALFAACAVLAASSGEAAPKEVPVQDAIRAASGQPTRGVYDDAEGWTCNMSPFELRVYYRLEFLRRGLKYNFEPAHAKEWKEFIANDKSDMYGRLTGAYFLLDSDKEVRDFVEKQTQSENLRHRYNAARVVEMYVDRDARKTWGVDLLIKLLQDRSIDGSGIHSSPAGHFPDGDRDDIMQTPIDEICWSLGFMKVTKAVPALIAVLERLPKTSGAAFALGEIGDKRAIPALLKVLTDNSGYDHREVTALGQLKSIEAVPVLIAHLGHPRTTFGGLDKGETSVILEALLEIGDKQAIAPIEKYLKADFSEETKAVARRVLIQLKSTDPVGELIALLDTDSHKYERAQVIWTLVKYKDDRVLKKLTSLSRTSDSGYMRQEAILGLRTINSKQSLLVLASLLDLTFADALKLDMAGKLEVPNPKEDFPKVIAMCLNQCTKQEFGLDRKKWEDWINENVQQKDADAKK